MRSYEVATGLPVGTAQRDSTRRQPERSVSEDRMTMMKQNKPQECKTDNRGKRRGVPSKLIVFQTSTGPPPVQRAI